MKKFFLSALVFSTLLLIPTVKAAEYIEIEEDTRIIEENIEDDYYVIAKENIVIKGNVKGDLLVVAGNVDVQGTVGGDLFVAGGNINVSNKISGNVLIAGGQLKINDYIEKSVYVAGGTIIIDGEIGEDVNAAGGQITINGKVDDDLRVVGGTISVNGKIGDDLMMAVGSANILKNIGGDVYAAGENVSISSEKIGGDLVFFGNKTELVTSNSLLIGGERIVNEPKEVVSPEWNQEIDFGQIGILAMIFNLVWKALEIIGLIALGLLIIRFAPVKTNLIVANLKGFINQIQSFGVGCIAFIIGIIALIFLMVSLMGIPIAKFLVALALLSFTLITPIAGIALGRFFTGWFGQKHNHLLVLMIGIILLQMIEIIPVVGNLLEFYIFFLIIGAMVRWVLQKQQLLNATQNLIIKHKDININNVDEESQFELTSIKKVKKKKR